MSDGSVPTDISLEWTSSLDGLFSTQGADSTGAIQFFDDTLSVGDHNLEVKATDTDGLYAVLLIPFTVNGLPTAPSIQLDPSNPGTEDELVVTITAASTDPEGDPITYGFEWFKNGVSSSASTSISYRRPRPRGETWTVEVTPNDGLGDGTAASASLTIKYAYGDGCHDYAKHRGYDLDSIDLFRHDK